MREAIGPTRGAQVEILLRKAYFARKTYNARLGSSAASRLSAPRDRYPDVGRAGSARSPRAGDKRAAGLERVVLVPGNHGERFVREQMGIDPQMVVTMSNFVGYMIEEAVRLGFRQIVLIGHPGKLIKIAAGSFIPTAISPMRGWKLVAHLALLGARCRC